MHTKSNPQNSEIAQAVVDGCVRPSTLSRSPWCQGHGDVLGRGRPSTIAHDMNRRGSTPWSRGRNHLSQNSRGLQSCTMSATCRQMSCRLDTLADMLCRRVGDMTKDMSPTCRRHDTPCLQMKAWEDISD